MTRTITIHNGTELLASGRVDDGGIVRTEPWCEFDGLPLADVRALCRLRVLALTVTEQLPLFGGAE